MIDYQGSHICPLCNFKNSSVFFEKGKSTYIKCIECSGIFLEKSCLPDADTEVQRYLQHNNDVNDARYQNFVSPIVNRVLKKFSTNHHGLDFGAGTGPVIAKLLKDKDYKIEVYDPFFHNNPSLLNNKYDYIACCEVVEHFHNPKKEFELLKKLLKPRGLILIMTSLYNPEIDFKTWYYKDDPTHVFIYQKETFDYIKKHFGFEIKEIVII